MGRERQIKSCISTQFFGYWLCEIYIEAQFQLRVKINTGRFLLLDIPNITKCLSKGDVYKMCSQSLSGAVPSMVWVLMETIILGQLPKKLQPGVFD